MQQAEKFLFETEFEKPGTKRPPTKETHDPDTIPVFTEPDMSAARREAFEQGQAAGLDEARNEVSASAASALENLAGQVEALRSGLEAVAVDTRKQAAGIALLVGRSLARALVDREPTAEIEAMVAECFEHIDLQDTGERLIVRVPPALAEEIRTQIEALAERAGFSGVIAVVSDDEMMGGDCRAEWSSGGAERDQAAAEDKIEAAVRRYVNTERQVSEPISEEPAVDAIPDIQEAATHLYEDSKAVKLEQPEAAAAGEEAPAPADGSTPAAMDAGPVTAADARAEPEEPQAPAATPDDDGEPAAPQEPLPAAQEAEPLAEAEPAPDVPDIDAQPIDDTAVNASPDTEEPS